MPVTNLLYGPPGAGKSRTLTKLFIKAAEFGGPERVGAITYTRAGAEELRSRLAAHFGITGTPSQIKRRLPYVSTIHSICFKRLGVGHDQIVTNKRLIEFCQDQRLEVPSAYARDSGYVPDELDEPLPPESPGRNPTVVAIMRWAWSAARHRDWPIEDALGLLPPRQAYEQGITPEHLAALRDAYEVWKREHHLLDFEDLIEGGLKVHLPVHTLLVDEVQDNSPLLFKVADHWGYGPGVLNYALAGDFFQAIYRFAGGDPDLFRNHQGTWHTIGNSHRLSRDSAEYAKGLLSRAGWVDDRLDTWDGIGGQPVDGSTLYLARTNTLLDALYRNPFIEEGRPFAALRGYAPLATKAGEAYKFLYRLSTGASGRGIDVLATQLPSWAVPKGQRERLKKLKAEVTKPELERLFGQPLERLMGALPYADYFQKVVDNHGPRGLLMQPKHTISTIHGAKGREADHVVLARSWARLPAMEALRDPKPESLVAYVGCSRHRCTLQFDDSGDGVNYDFP
jgi:superfamily I DNA/RNA helicase